MPRVNLHITDTCGNQCYCPFKRDVCCTEVSSFFMLYIGTKIFACCLEAPLHRGACYCNSENNNDFEFPALVSSQISQMYLRALARMKQPCLKKYMKVAKVMPSGGVH